MRNKNGIEFSFLSRNALVSSVKKPLTLRVKSESGLKEKIRKHLRRGEFVIAELSSFGRKAKVRSGILKDASEALDYMRLRVPLKAYTVCVRGH